MFYIGNGNYGIIPTWKSVIVQNKLKNWAHSVSEEIGGLEEPSYLWYLDSFQMIALSI